MRGNHIDGLFLYSVEVNHIFINATNVKLNDLQQYHPNPSGILLWFNQNTDAILQNITVSNSGGYNAHLLYLGEDCDVIMSNIELDNFYSQNAAMLFNYGAISSHNGQLTIDNLMINNHISPGVLFGISFGTIVVENSKIKNIHNERIDNIKNTNNLLLDNEIGVLKDREAKLIIKNTIFENVYGVSGFSLNDKTYVEFINDTVNNCYFKEGLFKIDDNDYEREISISNSFFSNNTADYGTIVNIQSLESNLSNSKILIHDSIFKNNTALKFGGVIYSSSIITKNHVYLNDCEFINNHAQMGNDIFSFNKNSEPNISNIEKLREVKGSIATNPTNLILNGSPIIIQNILSGEKTQEGISCSIYDDYGNLINFETDISNVGFNEFMFFNLRLNDTYNAALVGNINSYCWGDSCIFPSVKVVGNPGIYNLRLVINSFGKFLPFEKNYIDILINITECDKSYLYQSIDNVKFKSCYLPSCEPLCGSFGECVNINVCKCTSPFYTGDLCNEHFKMKRHKVIDWIVIVVTICLLIVTMLSLILTIIHRDNYVIKGGSYDFLILILIGIFFNLTHIYFLTNERTKMNCYMIFFFNNVGFSLVFGSILVKALRVYTIFFMANKINQILGKVKMYLIVFSLVVFYTMVSIIWIKKRKIGIKSSLTKDYKEYNYCIYPKFKSICVVLNYVILVIGCFLSYSIRNVGANYKENLVVPLYVYVIFMGISETVFLQNDVPLLVKDFFEAVGSIIINSTVIYFQYILKFYTIYINRTIAIERSSQRSKGIINKNIRKNIFYSDTSLGYVKSHLKPIAFSNSQLGVGDPNYGTQ